MINSWRSWPLGHAGLSHEIPASLFHDRCARHRKALAFTLSHFGQQKFEEYQVLIREALAQLEANPTAPPAKQRRDIHPDAMTLHIGQPRRLARHLFLYRVMDADHIVQVGRLLHDAMDIRKHLPEDFGDK